jgi:hypothetical protein
MLRSRMRMRGGSGGGATEIWRVADTNSNIPNSVVSPASHATRWSYLNRFPVVIGSDDKDGLRFAFTNQYQKSDGTIGTINAPYTIDEMAIEAPDGTTARITFGGANGRVIPTSGGNEFLSDILAPISGGEFSVGDVYWVKLSHTHPSATGEAPNHSSAHDTTGITGAQVIRYNRSAVTYNAILSTGVFTITSGSDYNSTTRGLRPIVIGRTTTDYISVGFFGDSISEYSADTAGVVGVYGRGYLMRAAANNGTRPIAALNFSRASTGTSLLTGTTFWKAFLKYVTFPVENYGVNNFNINNTFTQIKDAKALIRADFATAGLTRSAMGDFFPYTTTTDTYLTYPNQTIKSNTIPDSFDSYQDALEVEAAALLTSGEINHFMPHLAARGAATNADPNYYKWVVDGATANYATSDGLHPSSLIHTNSIPEARRILDFEFFRTKMDYINSQGKLLGWFDPDFSDTITQSGGTVSNWTSKAGTNNAVQGAASAQATFTANAFALYRNGLTFNPADNEQYTLDTAIPDTDGVIAAFAIKPTVAGTNRYILGSAGTINGAQIHLNTSNLLVVSKFGGATLLTGSTALTAGNSYYVLVKYGASGIQIYINGVLDATTATVPTFAQGFKTIGGRGGNLCFSGVIGRIIFAKGTISAGEEEDVLNAVKFMTDI